VPCNVYGGFTADLAWKGETDIFPIDNQLQWPASIPDEAGIYLTMWGNSLNYVGKSGLNRGISNETYGYYNGMLKCCGDEVFRSAELFWATYPYSGDSLDDLERIFIALSYYVEPTLRNTQCRQILVLQPTIVRCHGVPAEPYELWSPALPGFKLLHPNLTITMD